MTNWFEGYLQSERDQQDFIFIKRIYLQMVGSNLTEAAILSRVMYWQPHLVITDSDGHKWLVKEYKDWQEECGVNERTDRAAINRLKAKDLIITKVAKFGGKTKLHIRINPDGFEKCYREVTDIKCHSRMTQNGNPYIQENTTGNTESSNGDDANAPPAVGSVPETELQVAIDAMNKWYDCKYIMVLPLSERLKEWDLKIGVLGGIIPPLPRPKKGYKKSNTYRLLERIIKHEALIAKKDGFLLSRICHWFWHNVDFSFTDLLDFIQWYHADKGINLPHKVEGDGVATFGWQEYWQEWQDTIWTTVYIPHEDCLTCGGAGHVLHNDGEPTPCGCAKEKRVRRDSV